MNSLPLSLSLSLAIYELYLYNTITSYTPQLRNASAPPRNETSGPQRVNERPAGNESFSRAIALLVLCYLVIPIEVRGCWEISHGLYPVGKFRPMLSVFADGNSFQLTTALNVSRKTPNECTLRFLRSPLGHQIVAVTTIACIYEMLRRANISLRTGD